MFASRGEGALSFTSMHCNSLVGIWVYHEFESGAVGATGFLNPGTIVCYDI